MVILISFCRHIDAYNKRNPTKAKSKANMTTNALYADATLNCMIITQNLQPGDRWRT